MHEPANSAVIPISCAKQRDDRLSMGNSPGRLSQTDSTRSASMAPGRSIRATGALPGPLIEALLLQLGDLRALQAETRHQALLVEDKGVHIVLQSRGRQRLCDTFVDDHDAGTYADLPAIALVQVLDGLVIHQEERVAKRLHARLQA